MDSYEIVREHFQDRQETPIKKVRDTDFTSAETIEQTPEKNPIQDIDAQYLFEHFEEIIKVTFLEEPIGFDRPIQSRLQYDDDGLLSPATKMPNDHPSPTSMKKKKLSDKKLQLSGIQLFPVSTKATEIPTTTLYETIKKPLKVDDSHNILVRKQPYLDQSL